MAGEKTGQVGPVSVRLAPEALRALRRVAENRGSTAHAEIVKAVDAYLARGGDEPDVGALKVATETLIDQFNWMAATPDAKPDDERLLLLQLVRVGLDRLMQALGAHDEPSAEVRSMGIAAARRVWNDMHREMGPLGEAGRALGVKDVGGQP
jgi:hypothetical protein